MVDGMMLLLLLPREGDNSIVFDFFGIEYDVLSALLKDDIMLD